MNYTPKVSIIVPVYKAEAFLHRCIDSILAQSFSDFELLLVDDGSPDSSGVICDTYAMNDKRIKVFHKTNGGVSSARNLGLMNASGHWIAFVDSDDYVNDEFLNVFWGDIPDVDLIHFGYTKEDINGQLSQQFRFQNQLIDSYLILNSDYFSSCSVSFFYSRCFLEENKIKFDVNLKYSEDRLFIIESILATDKKISLLNNTSYIYTYNPSSAVNTKRELHDSLSDLYIVNRLYSEHFYNKHHKKIKRYITPMLLSSFIYVYSLHTKQPFQNRHYAVKEFKNSLKFTSDSLSMYHYLFINVPSLVILYRKVFYRLSQCKKAILKQR